MLKNQIKVIYSAKNIIIMTGCIAVLMAGNTFVFFTCRDSLSSIIFAALATILAVFSFYLILNRIKRVSLYENGKILVDRFLLSSLTFDNNDIKFLSRDTVKIGKKVFSLDCVLNKRELFSFLLSAMKMENTEEAQIRYLPETSFAVMKIRKMRMRKMQLKHS
ncbi:hypothetical protein Cst_c05990 [Thermoclostridium stercorarium subsp. stercorarium DSM 8532]|jgi:hypothetical protein|uniref:Uncharacterized protein n=3 Tax=Thermoclostridium stercorarium TaxID=1510 RepID=L7VMC6_THES1|nr:hypothetical protein [Thermoclostridium stercorarium]AGC67621.1 hypothetical protein Cst_c05990 [Thermoclostridium stercorarium subsp. stercorarium DSM 8532]AGI38669.1 hypothetical protein Clst_0572 [Thermoclostridium stercorarium subsp. stercorarium DSM 8532]ANW98039.1 hypothetical protein CSTERTH_02765 [Thermoclostridium stercorarium subsp. thermolacticum DSM 2910]ANX00586.1 hypothetical protein CSTERLE_02755 [Thermoclostridium stercorarium subsp. leptospartum DSM 9219]